MGWIGQRRTRTSEDPPESRRVDAETDEVGWPEVDPAECQPDAGGSAEPGGGSEAGGGDGE